MRGYRHAMRCNQIGEVRKLEELLVNCNMSFSAGWVERVVFGRTSAKAEVVLRQFLIQRYAGPGFRSALFCAMGDKGLSITYPMPMRWQALLTDNGFAVNRLASSLGWGWIVLNRFLYGAFSIAKLCFACVLPSSSTGALSAGAYAHFIALNKRNLPSSLNGDLGYDVCSWYAGWSDRCTPVVTICHDVPGVPAKRLGAFTVEYRREPGAGLVGARQSGQFLLWASKALIFALFGLSRGRWWAAFMLTEAAQAKVVELAEADVLAKDYLFHFSRAIYRPMWTYMAEAKGARIICYFYSTYTQPRLDNVEQSQMFDWGPTTWPLFLVWDEYQANTLKRDLGSTTPIKVVGPIYFSDLVPVVPDVPNHSIAVFDIQPHRISSVCGISTLYEYYYANPVVHQKFLEDIHSVCQELRVTMILKSKRYIAKAGDKRYEWLLNKLTVQDGFCIASPELAAPRLMKACIGAISAPFTSTALYFQDEGYPSVYYDPINRLQQSDPAAHGIQILTSRDELNVWVADLRSRAAADI